MVYTLRVDALEREVAMSSQTAVIAMALGASGIEVPDGAALRAQMDADLCSAGPVEGDPADDRNTLLRAVGLRR